MSSLKIITLDGYPCAGKSAQTYRLFEHYSGLNIGEMGEKFWRIHNFIGTAFTLAGFDRFLDDMTEMLSYVISYRLMVSHEKEHGYDMLFIQESFGLHAMKFRRHVRLLREILTAISDIEPVASFYIDVPENERAVRRINKEANHYRERVSVDLDTGVISDEDRNNTEKWRTLSEEIPYLHIIDGTQSIDVTSKEIISIIDQT